jgi:hypothetical protein
MPFQYTCPVCKSTFWRARKHSPGIKCSIKCRDFRPTIVEFIPDMGMAKVSLHRRDRSISGYALVDISDAHRVSEYKWHINANGYAATTTRINGQWVNIGMHRMILGLQPGEKWCGDHINRDRLDNRRINLREVTRTTNAQNRTPYRGTSSKYRGVSFRKDRGCWVAYVYADGKRMHLGFFDKEDDAAEASRSARSSLLPYSTD